MKPITDHFREDLRYEYPLAPESLVLDCGGYKGDFAAEIHRRYGCSVVVFEPIVEFYNRIVERFKGNEKIRVNNVAVGTNPGLTVKQFSIKGDMTGEFAEGPKESVAVISLVEFCEDLPEVALLKLNVEGGEFDLLDELIASGAVKKLQNIQVQFHPIFVDAKERHEKIRSQLLDTHELTFDFPWCWENYRRKS